METFTLNDKLNSLYTINDGKNALWKYMIKYAAVCAIFLAMLVWLNSDCLGPIWISVKAMFEKLWAMIASAKSKGK
jgi:hypothetical protein